MYRELVEAVERSDGQIHPYYTVPEEDSGTKEFLYVFCKIKIFTEEYEGYAFINNDELISFTVFYDKNSYLLSQSYPLDEDNYENISRFTGAKPSGNVTQLCDSVKIITLKSAH